MQKFLQSRVRSFKYAFSGCLYVIRTQKNSWLHLLATIVTLTLASWLKLGANSWAILVLTITLVWTAEIINSSIELIVDLTNPKMHPLARIIKDVSAASVLFVAIGSIIIGLILLGPPIWLQISHLLNTNR